MRTAPLTKEFILTENLAYRIFKLSAPIFTFILRPYPIKICLKLFGAMFP